MCFPVVDGNLFCSTCNDELLICIDAEEQPMMFNYLRRVLEQISKVGVSFVKAA